MHDLISRQAAIDAADRADYTGLAVEDVKKVTDEVVKELKQIPSAEPERRNGHWVVRNEYSMWPILCSECRGWQSGPSRFCPECGADMRGEEDG